MGKKIRFGDGISCPDDEEKARIEVVREGKHEKESKRRKGESAWDLRGERGRAVRAEYMRAGRAAGKTGVGLLHSPASFLYFEVLQILLV